MLKALLEPETWNAAAATLGEEFAAGAGGGAARRPLAAAGRAGTRAGAGVRPDARSGAVGRGGARGAGSDTPVRPSGNLVPATAEPVLEMLADRDREDPDPPRRGALFALLGVGVVALAGAAAVIGATQFIDSDTIQGRRGRRRRHAQLRPREGRSARGAVRVRPADLLVLLDRLGTRSTVLFREPGGAPRLRLTRRTEWESPRVLGVVGQRGGWLGVQARS